MERGERMKKILWYLWEKKVMFNVNWFEYLILKNIFNKQKYKILKSKEIRGYQLNAVIFDEAMERR